MIRKVSEALIDHAQELVEAGVDLIDASAEIGVHPNVLSKKLKARGVVIRRGATGGRNRLNLPEADIVAEYQSGAGTPAIAAKYGVSTMAIRNLLIRNAVPLRSVESP